MEQQFMQNVQELFSYIHKLERDNKILEHKLKTVTEKFESAKDLSYHAENISRYFNENPVFINFSEKDLAFIIGRYHLFIREKNQERDEFFHKLEAEIRESPSDREKITVKYFSEFLNNHQF